MEKIKVLLIHDNKNILEEIEKSLNDLKYAKVVGKLNSNEKVYETIRKERTKIIFMKYNMKQLDAINLIEEMAEELGDKVPDFKFISEDLSEIRTSNRYMEDNGFFAVVKEYGKKGIVEYVQKYIQL